MRDFAQRMRQWPVRNPDFDFKSRNGGLSPVPYALSDVDDRSKLLLEG